MANIEKKNQTLELRKRGRSIYEIAEKLNVPKSTVSVWCRNIKLGKQQIERLSKRQESGSYKGRVKFLERIRGERIFQTERLRRKGLNEIRNISRRDLFVSGVAMYLSEGSTSEGNEEVSFTNSDFRTVLFMKKWFIEICDVPLDRFVIQVRINRTHRENTKRIERYWSQITGISLNQFTKTILINSKLKKIYPKNNTYYGTIRLKVRRGTELRRKINGWVEGLLKT